MREQKYYSQILKASSIMGGAAGITQLLSLIRVKLAAVLIGSVGVGLIASFGALQGLIGTLTGLGIQASAVRGISDATSRGDAQTVSRLVVVIRRACLLTGLVGFGVTILLSSLLSQLTFGGDEYRVDIAALGLVVLLTNMSAAHTALIQGVRRISDLARINVTVALVSTLVAPAFYGLWGFRGVVPAMVALAGTQLVASFHFARGVKINHVEVTWRETFFDAAGLMRLGAATVWTGLVGSAVAYMTVRLIGQYDGIKSIGLYSAAFAISGVFVNFVLGAMGADYYPRLTGLSSNPKEMRHLVNEQTEVGLLLAVPGLLLTMVFAPWILDLLYADEFIASAELLRWFALGCLARVLSWPLGYVMLALGRSGMLVATETLTHLVHALMIFVALKFVGLIGVGQAFVILYVFHFLINLYVGRQLIQFRLSRRVVVITVISSLIVVLIFASSQFFERTTSLAVGLPSIAIALTASAYLLLRGIGRDGSLRSAIGRKFKFSRR